MESETSHTGFQIWGADNTIYGPVELPELVNWVQDQRVTADTWIYSEKDDRWNKAAHTHELQMFFRRKSTAARLTVRTGHPVLPETLRRVKILADLSDDDLARFLSFMEVQEVRQWTVVVRQDDAGDAMFLVLEGELRARLLIEGRETTLVTLGPGDFFGEVALFDHGPRSADVLANTDALLLKISHEAFTNLSLAAPELAAPILMGIGKTLTARIRADNKRYRDSIVFARAGV